MISLINWLKALFNKPVVKDPVKIFMEQIELMDNGIVNNRLEDTYNLILEFWQDFEVSNLTNLSVRNLIGIKLELKHKNIVSLMNNLEMINNLIQVKDYSELARVGNLIHNANYHVTLNGYFTDNEGYSKNVKDSLNQMKRILNHQKELLSEVDNLNRLWPVSQVYLDLLQLTTYLLTHTLGNETNGIYQGHD